MILAENLFMYLDGPTIERLGLVILALLSKQDGEVVVPDRNVGMILAENLFADLDRPTKERLGLRMRLEATEVPRVIRRRAIKMFHGDLVRAWATDADARRCLGRDPAQQRRAA